MAGPVLSKFCFNIGLKSFLQSSTRSVTHLKGNRNILTLKVRGVFQNVFPEERAHELEKLLIGKPQCLYCGFDPTADSLHVGNLLAIVALLHCRRSGHDTVALIGGATAQIGDPSGKSQERDAMHIDKLQHNATQLRNSLQQIFFNHELYFCKSDQSLGSPTKILDNAAWYAERNVIEFLSTVGRYFRMGAMLHRESVQQRLKSAEGMSLTEFTYQMFQAYDWLHLYKHHNCAIQIGGNDQLGNIAAGYDLISRVRNKFVFGLTVPLVTTETGDKLGKTAGNAVWLNSDKTSPFDLYQYFLRMADGEVEKYLNLFTFITDKDVTKIAREHKYAPDSRKAQKILAEQVTLLVHGEEGVESAKRCTEALYSSDAECLGQLSDLELTDLFRSAPTFELMLEAGITVLDIVLKAGCFDREVDARRVISAGGVYMNKQRVTQADYVLIPGQHILFNNITLIRVGKKNYYLIKWKLTGFDTSSW